MSNIYFLHICHIRSCLLVRRPPFISFGDIAETVTIQHIEMQSSFLDPSFTATFNNPNLNPPTMDVYQNGEAANSWFAVPGPVINPNPMLDHGPIHPPGCGCALHDTYLSTQAVTYGNWHKPNSPDYLPQNPPSNTIPPLVVAGVSQTPMPSSPTHEPGPVCQAPITIASEANYVASSSGVSSPHSHRAGFYSRIPQWQETRRDSPSVGTGTAGAANTPQTRKGPLYKGPKKRGPPKGTKRPRKFTLEAVSEVTVGASAGLSAIPGSHAPLKRARRKATNEAPDTTSKDPANASFKSEADEASEVSVGQRAMAPSISAVQMQTSTNERPCVPQEGNMNQPDQNQMVSSDLIQQQLQHCMEQCESLSKETVELRKDLQRVTFENAALSRNTTDLGREVVDIKSKMMNYVSHGDRIQQHDISIPGCFP